MGIFDWIPTIDEVVAFIDCRIMGHDWVLIQNGNEVIIICANCGKRK